MIPQDQKNQPIEFSQSLKERTQYDPGFVKNDVIDDETWVCGCGIETKRQSSQ